MPHAALWVVQQTTLVAWDEVENLFQCRTRLFPFAPTTASRSPSPARAGEAWLRSVFSQNHAILASPADAGERSTSANHTSFYSCSWDVFPYDLFPVQLCPMGLLLGQVSKWRAQRADRGAHAARGFVGGATENLLVPVEQVEGFNAARGFVGGAAQAERNPQPDRHSVSMPHAALCVVQPHPHDVPFRSLHRLYHSRDYAK